MYEATFRIAGEGTYETATRETDATVELWCNDHCDLLYVSERTGSRIEQRVSDHVGVKHAIKDGTEVILVTDECLKNHTSNNIESYLSRHDCLLLPPIRYKNGEKICRIVTINSDHMTNFYNDVRQEFSITVDSKREISKFSQNRPLLALDSTLPELSQQQQTALATAYQEGYYQIPREVTTAELATKMDINRRTFEEHLRRAENKLMQMMVELHY